MEYDLIRLFDHPVNLFDFIASAIVALGTDGKAERRIEVEWRRSAGELSNRAELLLKWDLDTIRARNPLIDRQIESIRERDEHLGKRTELG